MSDLPAGVTAHDVDTARLRMRYYEAGPDDGIPVVLLHGEPTWSFMFRRVIARLAEARVEIAMARR